jgi:hypothetical protein
MGHKRIYNYSFLPVHELPPKRAYLIDNSTIIPGVREYRLLDGKLEIVVVILRYFSDNGG